MLLRIRVRLPDRPGSLGKVARILGAAGADVVQMAVLERDAGRALDDFTVAWPSGAGIDRLCDGLAFIPGVDIEGVWPTVESQGAFPDAALVGQLASNPDGALVILADAVPSILSADWAGLLRVTPGEAILVHTSLGVFADLDLPEVHPLRPRSFTSRDGTQYAVAPIGEAGLAVLVARTAAPQFHRTEVFRLAQLVSATEAVLGTRLTLMAAAVDAVPAVSTDVP
ncbi:ACT domain-containing protein [Actinomadura scrupuli]|uniref:ACT domain-containing protein n=1 Tax=Actinomadura scrupuli TaxID=559629 RepID=UPI003D973E7C